MKIKTMNKLLSIIFKVNCKNWKFDTGLFELVYTSKMHTFLKEGGCIHMRHEGFCYPFDGDKLKVVLLKSGIISEKTKFEAVKFVKEMDN